jgi:hypothetical protein
MRLHNALALVVALGIAPLTARAQSAQRWSVQVSWLYANLQGDAYSALQPGSGYEAQVRYTTRTGFSFGGGWQYTKHDDSGTPTPISGPFFEPRYTFVLGGNESFFPYVSARLSYLVMNQAYASDSASYTFKTSGATYSVGGGVLIRLSSNMNLDLGATFGLTNFGPAEYTFTNSIGAEKFKDTQQFGSGKNIIARAGLSFGLK